MNPQYIIFISLLAFGLVPVARAKVTAPEGADESTYIVVLKQRSPQAMESLARSIEATCGATLVTTYENALGGFLMNVPQTTVDQLRNDSRIAFVEEDRSIAPMSSADPVKITGKGYAWHLDRIDEQSPAGMDDYYGYCSTGLGTTVYLVDTGVRLPNHAELGGFRITAQHNFTGDDDSEPINDSCLWHGTATASIIGGEDLGVAPGASIVDLKVVSNPFSDQCGWDGRISYIVAALDWVIANGSHPGVVNISGFRVPREDNGVAPKSLEVAVADVVGAGFPVITSANNFSPGQPIEYQNACNDSPSNLGCSNPQCSGTGDTGWVRDGNGNLVETVVNEVVLTVAGSDLTVHRRTTRPSGWSRNRPIRGSTRAGLPRRLAHASVSGLREPRFHTPTA